MQKSPAERFWAKVDKSAGPYGCWPWLGALNNGMYGVFTPYSGENRQTTAHRFAYILTNGPISPPSLQVDHLCRVRQCANPRHLRLTTNRENSLAGHSFSALNARKTHCDHGHELTGDNVYNWRGSRLCRTCRSRVSLASYHNSNGREKQNARRKVGVPT